MKLTVNTGRKNTMEICIEPQEANSIGFYERHKLCAFSYFKGTSQRKQ